MRFLQKSPNLKILLLVVIDEEQHFGVAKERLKELKMRFIF